MARRFLVLLLLLSSACLWRSYEKILNVHLDVLTQTADKLCDVAGGQTTTLAMTEYVYPAKRARQFLHQFSKHRDRPSYIGLAAFLDRYEKMIDEVGAVRPGDSIDIEKLRGEAAELRHAATTIRARAAQKL